MPAKTKTAKPNAAKSKSGRLLARTRFNQAVVIFHGIGEQRPMETLRGFADAILPDPKLGEEKYFSKPDPMSESFELRKLQNRTQPRTHLFEYYWAYKIEGTVLGDIWSWLKTLLWRMPNKVPKQLLPLWYFSWLLIAGAIGGALFGLFNNFSDITTKSPSFLISAGSALVFTGIQWFVIHYIGDAARYLSATTRNIKLRHEIRADGIKLLKKIQEEGKYDRIIFVGHSLGSVIAYDILRQVWEEYQEDYRLPQKSDQPALAEVEKIGEALRDNKNEFTLKDYMDAQVNLWKEIRALGHPWLVTDLVTIGSPLAHAAMLLARDDNDLRSRQRQRELPTNPPEYEIEKIKKVERRVYSYKVWDKYGKKKDITLRALHDAGLFACTRWTNIYFPAYLNVFGDIVGGPLRKLFGPGIRDIAVRSNKIIRDRTLPAHNSYWASETTSETSSSDELPNSLKTIIDVLDLSNKNYYKPIEKK